MPQNICKLCLAVVIDDFIDEPTRQALLDFLLHGAPSSTPGCAGNSSCQGSMQGGRAGATQGGAAAVDAADAAPAGAAAAAAAGMPGLQQPGLQQIAGPELPPGRWERRTADMAGGAPTWGVKQHVLAELATGSLPAMQVCARALCSLHCSQHAGSASAALAGVGEMCCQGACHTAPGVPSSTAAALALATKLLVAA